MAFWAGLERRATQLNDCPVPAPDSVLQELLRELVASLHHNVSGEQERIAVENNVTGQARQMLCVVESECCFLSLVLHLAILWFALSGSQRMNRLGLEQIRA